MKSKILLSGLIATIATIGCQSQTTSLYQWGNYQHNLLDYVTDLQGNDARQAQAAIEEYQQDLSKIIAETTSGNSKTRLVFIVNMDICIIYVVNMTRALLIIKKKPILIQNLNSL